MNKVYRVLAGEIEEFVLLSETPKGYRVKFLNSGNEAMAWKNKLHSRYDGTPRVFNTEKTFTSRRAAKQFAAEQLAYAAEWHWHKHQEYEKKRMRLC
jgi:hypothetical protein